MKLFRYKHLWWLVLPEQLRHSNNKRQITIKENLLEYLRSKKQMKWSISLNDYKELSLLFMSFWNAEQILRLSSKLRVSVWIRKNLKSATECHSHLKYLENLMLVQNLLYSITIFSMKNPLFSKLLLKENVTACNNLDLMKPKASKRI